MRKKRWSTLLATLSIVASVALLEVAPRVALADDGQMPAATVTQKEAVSAASVYTKMDRTATLGTASVPVVYNFAPDANSGVNSEAYASYKDWYADYVISFDEPVSAQSLGLYGSYGNYGDVALLLPEDISANTEVYLLASTGMDARLTYREVVTLVQSFDCGAFNLSDSNKGTTMTVKLNLFQRDAAGNAINVRTVAEQSYTFEAHTFWTVDNTDYYYVPTGLDTTSGKVLATDSLSLIAQTAEGPHFIPKDTSYTVSLSSQDTGSTTSVATVSGGGVIAAGDTTTVTATATSGYSFVGWYKNGYTDENFVSASRTYTFRPTANVSLVAVYEATSSFNLKVSGDAFQLDNSAQTGSVTRQVAAGSSHTVSYTGANTFMYWVNASDNVVSKEPNYSFTVVANTELRAVTALSSQSGSRVTAVFLNAYSQVISAGTAADQYDLAELFPNYRPSKMGYTFDKWIIQEDGNEEATIANILSHANTSNPILHVEPAYTQNSATYTVKVVLKNGESATELKTLSASVGNPIVITKDNVVQWANDANVTADGIAYWSMNGTDAVSYGNQYTALYANAGEHTLYAVVGSKAAQPVVNITQTFGSTVGAGTYKLSTTMKYFVPDGCTVTESGFVYGVDSSFANNESSLVLDGEKTYKHLTGMTDRSVTYTFNGTTTNSDTTLYIRGFVTYRDANGAYRTIYSTMKSYSYNNVKAA